MTEAEMRSVWELLGKFRPGDARLRDKTLMEAWLLTFAPYDARAVKGAVAAHFRQKRFWPDIGEITALLPPLDNVPVVVPGALKDAAKAGMDWRATFSRRWDAMMEARGYPLLEEWLERGKPADEWWAARARCQLDDPQWMAMLTADQREELRAAVAGA